MQRVFGKQFHDEHPAPFNGQDIGHGRHKHEPDWTWDRPELALSMAKSTYSLLVKLCAQYSGQCAGAAEDFAAFESTVLDFLMFPPEIYSDVFEAGPLQIIVPDVVSYEKKVRLLGEGFSTDSFREAKKRASRFAASQQRRADRASAQYQKAIGIR